MDTAITGMVGRTVENENGLVAPSNSQYQTFADPRSTILDKQWIQNAFLMPDYGFSDPEDVKNRYYSTANMKFTDTRLGASIGINPRPQFCQYSDVPIRGRFHRETPSISDFSGNYGQGRQYSEFIDDAAQRVYMTFGVPQFNSLSTFFTNAYEAHQTTLARTGRATSIFYTAGKLVGTGALLYAFPLVSVAMFVGGLYNMFVNKPKSKFYTMKPTMHLYWSAVNNLVQAMAVNRGIMPRFLAPEGMQQQGRAYFIDNEYLALLSEYMPDVFRDAGLGNTEDGGIAAPSFDIFAVATKAQRIADKILTDEYNQLDAANAQDFFGYVKRTMTGTGGHATPLQTSEGDIKFDVTMDQYLKSSVLLEKFFAKVSKVAAYLSNSPDDAGAVDSDPRGDPNNERAKAEGKGFTEHLDAQLRDGALFATFIVDHTGAQSETWSSSAGDSDLAQKLNGVVSGFNEARFSIAQGNIIGGIVGDMVGTAAKAVTDAVSGVLSGVTLGLSDTIMGLAGSGFIDIPKHWKESSFQPTRATYTMQLISPYGNPISQLMAIDIPLAMLLAGTLPRSTGKSSYTAPFLCQIFDRGRCQMRLAMIETLTVQRGTSHLSFSDTGQALAIDVSFTVMDLSSIMHMPISSGTFGGIDMTIDEDNVLQDYLAVLAGMSVESQIYTIPRLRLKVAKALMNMSKYTSPAYYGSVFGNTSVAEFMRLFTRQSAAIDVYGSTF